MFSTMPLTIDDILVPAERREVDPAVVKRLADSIDKVGLRHPITVRRIRGSDGHKYLLVAGRHRIEACRMLGRDYVQATIASMTNAEARMWEIAENLHRAELTKLERAEQIEEWRKLSAQVAHSSHPAERGVSATAEALGVDRAEVQRSEKIASMTPEAKAAAVEAGIDDNQSKLLAVAKEEPDQQVAKVIALKSVPAKSKPEPEDDEEADIEPHFEADIEPENYRSAFLLRADVARQMAVYSGPVDEDVIGMARVARDAWRLLASKLDQSEEDESDADGDAAEVAPPAEIEENVLYVIERANENARACRKILKASALCTSESNRLNREAAERISAAARDAAAKWTKIADDLEKWTKPRAPRGAA